jgi:heat shock protein HtpX
MIKTIKTFVLLAALSGLLLFVGQAWQGTAGLTVALVIALVMNGSAYWFSDKIAIKMARAKPASEAEYPWYHRMVHDLALKASKPGPRLYVSPSPQPNAFATGRNPKHAAVCVNQGLIQLLDQDEMEGVLAHELQHVYNRDILVGSVAATLAAAVTFLSRFALFFGGNRENQNPVIAIAAMILAPIGAMLVQMAISRTREYSADRLGATICGQPIWLARALQKIEQLVKGRLMQTAENNPATAHMFIVNPLIRGGVDNLFRTHPPTADRIRRLQELAGAPTRGAGPWA